MGSSVTKYFFFVFLICSLEAKMAISKEFIDKLNPIFFWSGAFLNISIDNFSSGYSYSLSREKKVVQMHQKRSLDGVELKGGYQKSFGSLVLGLDVGLSHYFLSKKIASLQFLAHTNGRIGLALGPFLLYVSGGMAYAKLKEFSHLGSVSYTKSHCGFTGYEFGGGVSYSLSNNWFFNAEYVSSKLKNNHLAQSFISPIYIAHERFGFSYKF